MQSRIIAIAVILLAAAGRVDAQVTLTDDDATAVESQLRERTAVATPASVEPTASGLLSSARTGTTVPEADPQSIDLKRACDGCPPRSVGKAMWHTTAINGFYELANLIRGQETAKITPATWWDNMQQGWVWDLDDFAVNQIGHPYQGNNYFNAARANGLSFWEASAVTAFGSGTWEFYGETNHPSMNDLINTTLGGIALGETFHRLGWMIRKPQASGRGRLWSEIGATALDPVTGLERFISGDASRVTEKPREFVPTSLAGVGSAGVLWRGSQTNEFSQSTADPFVEMDLVYGDPESGHSRTPYDAFLVRLRFGGGSAFSEAKVRGRLLGQPLKGGKLQFDVIQDYSFESNDAFATGGQAFQASLGSAFNLSERTHLWVMGWGGLSVLSAVDSLPLGVTEKPVEDASPDAPQGVSEGPRYYDYGPGSMFGGSAHLTRNQRNFVNFFYEGRHVYSLDGVRANHLLQWTRVDLMVPLHRVIGAGTSFEYFKRTTYYQDAAHSEQRFHYPQLRAYLTWFLS
jgi:hypothetical protein